MYMGKSLLKSEAKRFINRTEVKTIVLPAMPYYEWNQQIKMRDENWGLIIFNHTNQSFCLISSKLKQYLQKRFLTIHNEHVAKVLLSIGAIKPVDKSCNESVLVSEEVKIISANILLPRLAMNINSDKVYQLRADTGERLFF